MWCTTAHLYLFSLAELFSERAVWAWEDSETLRKKKYIYVPCICGQVKLLEGKSELVRQVTLTKQIRNISTGVYFEDHVTPWKWNQIKILGNIFAYHLKLCLISWSTRHGSVPAAPGLLLLSVRASNNIFWSWCLIPVETILSQQNNTDLPVSMDDIWNMCWIYRKRTGTGNHRREALVQANLS